MSKLTFWGRLLSDNSGAVGLPFEKMAWATDGVDQHDKNVLVVRGLFVCSPFCFGRASSLQESSKDYSLSKSNRKSDNVGLPLGEY